MNDLKLMIPGPVDVADDVRKAMGSATIPHYGDAWVELYGEVLEVLKQIHSTQNDLYLMLGPGTAGLDAALGSVLSQGEKVLVATNGFFGDRLATVATCCGLDVVTVRFPPHRPIDPGAVAERLAADGDIRLVGLVHHETSTGMLNPVKSISEAVHEQGVAILVDAVSSLGGVPLLVDEWELDLVVSVANKCLAGPPGFTSVTVSPRAWDMIVQRPDRGRGWYLNLETWREYADKWGDWHPQPVTVPGQNLLAVAVALRRIMGRGLERHFEEFVRIAESVRAGMALMGFELFLEPEWTCPLVSTFKTLPGTRPDDIARFLVEEHSIKIAPGIGELRDQVFRIGHMGLAQSDEYVRAVLAGVNDYVGGVDRGEPPTQTPGW